MAEKPTIHVALALVNRAGCWLVTRRPDHVHLGGSWEFPGGKCEPDESPQQAALRELLEECALHAAVVRKLATVEYDYGDRIVRLTPVECQWTGGEPRPVASDEYRWVSKRELRGLNIPPANAQLIDDLPEGD